MGFNDICSTGLLGFSQQEVNFLVDILKSGYSTSVSALMQIGITYEQAKRINYMYSICTGKTTIETTDDLVRHLRKINGNRHRIGIYDLPVSKVSDVPRIAIVNGIKDTTFSVYNKGVYKVYSVTSTNIIVQTLKKPILKYKQSKFIDGVVEILEVNTDGILKVSFNKNYSRLCNRYIIAAGFRRPEFHHGLTEIIAIDGTRLYVYAQTLEDKYKLNYNIGTQRIYSYGFKSSEIVDKLKEVSGYIYNSVAGVYSELYPANADFKLIGDKKETQDTSDVDY